MSNAAITWAFNAPIAKSADKLLLVCLANYANDTNLCWPSHARLVEKTALDRKTVIAGIHRLTASGWIVATEERAGPNGRVVVYRLAIERSHPLPPGRSEGVNSPVFPNSDPPPMVPKFPIDGPVSGTNETQCDGPVFPDRSSQISASMVPNFPIDGPKFGLRNPYRTLIEPSLNPQGTAQGADLLEALNDSVEGQTPPAAMPFQPKVEKAAKREAKRSRVPDDWWPDAAGLEFAAQHGVNPTEEVPRMIAHHQAKGNLMASWPAAWRTWCMNQVRFRERDTQSARAGGGSGSRRPDRAETVRSGLRFLLGDPGPEPPPHDGPTIDVTPEEYAYHG